MTLDANERALGLLGGGLGETVLIASAPFFLPIAGIIAWRLFRGDWQERRVLLAFLALAGLLYAAIALGRSGLQASLGRIATRGRYHYDANVCLVIAAALAIARLRLRPG